MSVSKITFTIFVCGLLLHYNCLIAQNSDLDKWPKGSAPEEIGKRIAAKFLSSPHSQYGNTKPDKPPTQITYPDVCTWLGGLWFAQVTNDKDLFNKLQSRFEPLFAAEKHLQPKPNHV